MVDPFESYAIINKLVTINPLAEPIENRPWIFCSLTGSQSMNKETL